MTVFRAIFFTKKDISKFSNKLGHIHGKDMINFNKYSFSWHNCTIFLCIQKYLSIAQFLPNLCVTFLAGYSCVRKIAMSNPQPSIEISGYIDPFRIYKIPNISYQSMQKIVSIIFGCALLF